MLCSSQFDTTMLKGRRGKYIAVLLLNPVSTVSYYNSGGGRSQAIIVATHSFVAGLTGILAHSTTAHWNGVKVSKYISGRGKFLCSRRKDHLDGRNLLDVQRCRLTVASLARERRAMLCEPFITAVPELRLHLLKWSSDHAIPEQRPFKHVPRASRSKMLRQMSRRGF